MLKKLNKDKNLLKANELAIAGRFLEAVEIYRDLADQDTRDFNVKFLLGLAYLQSDQFHNAIKELQDCLEIKPNLLLANHALGCALFMIEEFEASIKSFDLEIEINPTYADAYSDKAYALNELKRFNESLDMAKIAKQLDPFYADPYNAIAASLNEIDQYDEAMENVLRAIDIDRSKPNYTYTLGNIFLNKGELCNALNSYKTALELNPKYEEASFNKSLIYLRLLDFESGWKLYEYRFTTYPKESRNRFITKDFFGKNIDSLERIFIFKEQGIGDQILYASVFNEIDKKENIIYIEINEKLLPVFNRSFKNLKFVTAKNYPNADSYDSTFGIASLPSFFRKNINSFHIDRDSFLLSDIDKTSKYRHRLLSEAPLNKICGLSWYSKNEAIGKYKTLDLINFKEILEIPGITFVNLQYNSTVEELELFQSTYKVSIKNFNEVDLFNDIDSLCSLIDACDFIVTISNINAHVAGALGKKTFLLAPFSRGRHWYWHDNLTKSLWYPSVEIFSQNETRDWSVPINEIKENIVKEIAHE
ncbi:tetratricopeptide repeat protein [Candidatus Methylopumilus universalis]|uniref:tetratricopeptide repeat protein n=1 Tax=Candidatus Methylopumilus universalis TaxID=2588536 RepID=UPI001123B9B3|nr:tetratricopeptide repeat protein [Candidatus Methylopumilus universalis]QDC70842.1 tetratricopeptide repeat protein [Candidatus Methylopumilus universalis]